MGDRGAFAWATVVTELGQATRNNRPRGAAAENAGLAFDLGGHHCVRTAACLAEARPTPEALRKKKSGRASESLTYAPRA
jgi:hypothetical protein